MTPQSTFMIVAPLAQGKERELAELLASMCGAKGMANPHNPLVPFGEFERLHVARFFILRDPTPDDMDAYGLPRLDWPMSLCFLGDCDGSADDLLADLAQHAGAGLCTIFGFCREPPQQGELLAWMRARGSRPAANYVNWIGRTVRQIREEAKLRDVLLEHLRDGAVGAHEDPVALRDRLVRFVQEERRAGRLRLSDPEPTPTGWWLCNLLHLLGIPLFLLILAPFLILYLPIFAWQLRRRETTDREIAPPPDPAHARALSEIEDHDVTNQFSAFGTVKPGLFRRWTVSFLLLLLDYSARHIYNHGYLTRVQTIHFARWVFVDGKKHLLFASNYDGSLESYMDDFINKVGWGLNLVFSNGVGYPTTNWLINDGSKDEQRFKYFLRRHELPTQVWYKAYPGLTTFDLTRNTRIREGLEQELMSANEARRWLALL